MAEPGRVQVTPAKDIGFMGATVSQTLKKSILLPKLFWPTLRKNCFNDRQNLLKFETEGGEFAKNLRSLEKFVQTLKGQNNFW